MVVEMTKYQVTKSYLVKSPTDKVAAAARTAEGQTTVVAATASETGTDKVAGGFEPFYPELAALFGGEDL